MLRMVFKEEGVRFRREEEDGIYLYEFPDRGINLALLGSTFGFLSENL
ncbi:MAG: hypothetical protein AAF490_02480 [Chloroflexota bacterium]